MKKHVLFLATLLLSTLGAVAQTMTDITSSYLKNANLEGSYSVHSNPSADRAIYQPEEWTITYSDQNSNDMTIMKAGDLAENNFTGKLAVIEGNQSFLVRERWGSTTSIGIKQNLTLPAGTYRLYAQIARYNGSGTVCIYAGENRTTTTSSTWTKVYVQFISDGSPIEVGFSCTQAKTEEQIAGVDDFQLVQVTDAETQTCPAKDTEIEINGSKYKVVSENLIQNGSFDHANNFEHWTNATGGGLSTDKFTTGTGVYGSSLKAKTSEGSTAAGSIRTLWTVEKNTDYVFSYQYKGGSNEYHKVSLTNTAGTESNVISNNNKENKTEWTKIEIAFNSGDYEKVQALYRWIGNGCEFDEFYLVKVELANLDLTDWNNAKAAAQTALDAYDETYAAIERAAVTDAMASTPTSVTEMSAMVNDLNTKVATYTTKAANEKLMNDNKELTDAIARIKAEYPNSSSDVLNTDLSKWVTSTYVVMNSNQHWSGASSYKYYEQSSAQWGQNSWNVGAEQTVNLPAGKYAFVVTARGSAGITSTLTVNGTTINLCHKGDVGYGIATDGEATFDMTKTFANGGNGRGWEYAFVEFELSESKDVTFNFTSSTNAVHNWVSIANPELYYNDAAKEAMENVKKQVVLDQIAEVVIPDTEGKALNATVSTNLDNAKTAADGASLSNTMEELKEIKANLESACAAATASLQIYAEAEAILKAADENIDRNAMEDDYESEIAETFATQTYTYYFRTLETIDDLRNAYIAALKAYPADDADFTVLMANPSFEEGTTGWTNVRNTTGTYDYRTDGANPADGNLTLNAWADQVNYINVWQKVTLPIGTYTLTAKARTNAETLEGKTQVRTYVSGKETSHSNDLTYTATEDYAWNSQEAWQTLTTTFTITQETEVEMGIYSTGVNIMGDHRGWFQVDDFQLVRVSDAPKATVHAYVNDKAKYGTFCAPFDVKLDYYVKAYIAEKIENNSLVLDQLEGNNVPAHTPVIIYYGGTYTTDFTGYITEGTPQAGLLTGTYEKIAAPVGSYLLQNQNGVVGFYRVDSEGLTVGANRAYLTTPEGTNVKGFLLEQTDAIEAVQALTEGKAKIYDVNGRQLQSLQKGINIVGGHKIMVK